jgi:hypothetical protein
MVAESVAEDDGEEMKTLWASIYGPFAYDLSEFHLQTPI